MNAPCKNCKGRYLGCHDSCERYAEFCKYKEAERKQRAFENDANFLDHDRMAANYKRKIKDSARRKFKMN